MNRITKNFVKKNKKYLDGRFPDNMYYLFSQMIRKELLSDIVEYESLIANKLIDKLDLFSLTRRDVEKYYDNIEYISEEIESYIFHNMEIDYVDIDDKWGLKPGTSKSIETNIKTGSLLNFIKTIKDFSKRGSRVKVRIIFEELTFGSKIHLIKCIDDDLVKEVLWEILKDKDTYFNHLKDELEPLNEFLYPLLEYIRDIRNILAHRDISLNSQDLFYNAYSNVERKYKINKLIEMFCDQLLLIHDDKFSERFKTKVNNNEKIDNEIYEYIFTKDNWNGL